MTSPLTRLRRALSDLEDLHDLGVGDWHEINARAIAAINELNRVAGIPVIGAP